MCISMKKYIHILIYNINYICKSFIIQLVGTKLYSIYIAIIYIVIIFIERRRYFSMR